MSDLTLSPLVLRTLGKSGRVKLLECLSKVPGRKFSLNELSREAEVPLKTAQRAVTELYQLEMVRVEKIGNTSAICLNERSSLCSSVLNLRMEDPHIVLAKQFAKKVSKVQGVVGCYLFGSTALSKHKTSSDVDVAIVYDRKKTALKQLQNKALRFLSSTTALVPLFFSSEEINKPSLENKRLIEDILRGEILWKQKKQ